MRVPLSWLREHVDLPEGESGRAVAERLVRVGLEVETVEEVGAEITGPLVVGRVVEFTEETHANGKTIRWCRVDVGADRADADGGGRGIVCGALNFAVGDLVVVSLPGAVLPGGFAISARQTYGHVSDGMICSARELALGDEADGILVLPPGTASPGEDAVVVLGLRDEVLDIAVTPDRGYALSVRGVAREAATAYGVPLRDPAAVQPPADAGPDWPVTVEDAGGCDRFVARTVTGFDESAPSPWWLQRRVQLAGMRPISLAVDVTNYVMLELGQPLHAYDRQRLSGPIVVRRAAAGERLRTLDGSTRVLDPDDLVIADDTGAVGIAGVMGGAATEIGPTTTDIVIEAAHFDPTAVARAARRHRLPSEASRRFERGVDSRLQEAAAERAVRLLAELGGATAPPTATVVDLAVSPERITLELGEPARLVGYPYPHGEVVRLLVAVGCDVEVDGPRATVTPPSWRPDLQLTADLVEEVARLHGYDAIPSRLPQAPAGGGLTPEQRLRRRVGLALAGAGYVEVLTYPFVGPSIHDVFALDPDDHRRRALRLVNPLSDEEPDLRTTLLPGLLGVLRRNVGRGFGDVGLFESGLVYRARVGAPARAPRPGVASRPSDAEVAALLDALPDQPRHVAVVLAGDREPAGWWGPARPAVWADAVEAARTVAGAVGAALATRAGQQPPWHPGRCAVLLVADTVVGHAGELHPRTVAALGLPARTCAMELDLDALTRAAGGPVPAPQVSPFPVAKEDVALVVDEAVPVADVEQALRDGAGPLLESVRLFDVYTGPQVGEGRRSLAFSLRFRAHDRTLTEGEVGDARAGAVAEAGRRTGAALRG